VLAPLFGGRLPEGTSGPGLSAKLWEMGLRNLVDGWGSTPRERALQLPCDELVPDARLVLHRAVDVDAPPEVVFRWLCQMRVAPYSYDLIDNLGRRSPQQLTPGLDRLEIGQRFLIFRLVSFEQGRHITLGHRGPVFGELGITYWVEPGSRLLMRIACNPPRLPLAGHALALGDLVMARRQLLNFKRLAEAS